MMNRKSAPMNGNHLRAIFSSIALPVMFSRISWYSVSTAAWTLLGLACMRRAM